MPIKTIQLSIKTLDLVINNSHVLNLKQDEDYYALSFTLLYPRAGKTSINTVKTIPLQDNTTFKTCSEKVVFKEKVDMKGCIEVSVELLAINKKNGFELFLSNVFALSFKIATKTLASSINNIVLGKVLDQPINDIVAMLSKKQEMITLAKRTINLNYLFGNKTIELISNKEVMDKMPEIDINQVYFDDEAIVVEDKHNFAAYLDSASINLQCEIL